MSVEKKYSVVKVSQENIELSQVLANLITIRNYLYMMNSNMRPSAQNKAEYLRINQKIDLLDKKILNLAMTLNVPFDIQIEEVKNAD